MGLLAYLNKWARSVTGYDSVTRFGGTAHRLHSTGAVNLAGATIGTAGVAGDTFLSAVLIPSNATAITVTLTNFAQDETGAAAVITLTGSTTADTLYQFDQMLNYAGAASVTASVADKVVIWHGAP